MLATVTHAPNRQFGQGGPGLTLDCRWCWGKRGAPTDYRHYFCYSLPVAVVYPKIKWKNQSLSLILKWFFRMRENGAATACYQVLKRTPNRNGSRKTKDSRRPNDETFVGRRTAAGERHRNKEIFNLAQMKFKLNSRFPSRREYYQH